MRCVGMTLAVLAAVWACPVAAQTLQAEYDAAQAALDKGDYETAAAGFERLLTKMSAKQAASRSGAQIRVLLGEAQLALGQRSAAIESFERALPAFGGDSAEERRERTLHYDIGRAYEGLHDYDDARRHLEKAIGEGGYADDRRSALSLQVALARVTAFNAPDVARRALTSALPEVQALLKDQSDLLGDIYALRGRIELNHGQPLEAHDWFERAVKVAGGLTRKVSVADTRIRGDMALATYLLGDKDAARKYLAYTGAGHLPDGGLDYGADMELPNCAANELKPEDMVVVEFSVAADGRVVTATPIYSTRPGKAEIPFLRAVSQWSWAPESAAKLEPFWRQAIRLELRCSNEPQRVPLALSFKPVIDAWMKSKGIQPFEAGDLSHAAAAPILRRELERRDAAFGATSPQLLPLLLDLASNWTIGSKETAALLSRALPIAQAAAAPVELRTAIEIELANTTDKGWERRGALAALLKRLEADGSGQTRAAAWVRVTLGQAYEWWKNPSEASQLYRAVVDQPKSAVADADPIRQLALLRLASLSAADKKFDEASRILAATGLRPDQCALVDVAPMPTKAGLGSDAFPREALRWGFEGWVKVSYDIDTSGKPTGIRTVMAYPPFIFGPSTERAVADFRYRPIYREGTAVGCSGYTQPVRYGIVG